LLKLRRVVDVRFAVRSMEDMLTEQRQMPAYPFGRDLRNDAKVTRQSLPAALALYMAMSAMCTASERRRHPVQRARETRAGSAWLRRGVPTPWGGQWVIECENGELLFATRPAKEGVPPDAGKLFLRGLDGEIRELATDPVPYTDRAGALNAFAHAIATGTHRASRRPGATTSARLRPPLRACSRRPRTGAG
jgi:hypothetical protein